MPHAPIRIVCAAVAALALAACDDAAPRDSAEQTTLPALDPALAEALADPILTDPDLGQQANGDALRPPDRPPSGGLPPVDIAPIAPPVMPAHHAPAPKGACAQCAIARRSLTLGAFAAAQPDPAIRGCAAGIRYSARWAARMPAAIPLLADARVLVAAGNDEGECALRAVRFVTGAPVQGAIDFYDDRARAKGFSAEHRAEREMHALHGARNRDGAAYVVVAQPRAQGGSVIDLVVATAG
ncbi:MAG TPA: hypothetical protein VM657_08650 [Sphingomonas sp.]|nr:hypothetical protein [Sphingomonas sp.]